MHRENVGTKKPPRDGCVLVGGNEKSGTGKTKTAGPRALPAMEKAIRHESFTTGDGILQRRKGRGVDLMPANIACHRSFFPF